MNTATLEHAIVKVQYVNQPKGNAVSGSIKDANGDYYGVHKSALNRFQEGAEYEFDFSTNGAFRNIDVKTIQPIASARPQQRAQAHEQRQDVQRSGPVEPQRQPHGGGNGNGGNYRPTHPRDARRMFICSQMNALITSHQVQPNTQSIADAIAMLAEAYDATIGQEDAAG